MIVGISVNWMVGYGNSPILRVHVDYKEGEHQKRVQTVPWMPYRQRQGCLWVRDEGGGRWSYLIDNGNPGGFGGRTFELLQVDGTIVKVKGPWSSNPSSVRDFTKTVDLMGVIIIDRNGRHYGGSDYEVVTIQEAISRLEVPIEISLVEHGGEHSPTWNSWDVTTAKPSRLEGTEDLYVGDMKPIIDHWPVGFAGVIGHIQSTSAIPAAKACVAE